MGSRKERETKRKPHRGAMSKIKPNAAQFANAKHWLKLSLAHYNKIVIL
jgi:hypothetical protein